MYMIAMGTGRNGHSAISMVNMFAFIWKRFGFWKKKKWPNHTVKAKKNLNWIGTIGTDFQFSSETQSKHWMGFLASLPKRLLCAQFKIDLTHQKDFSLKITKRLWFSRHSKCFHASVNALLHEIWFYWMIWFWLNYEIGFSLFLGNFLMTKRTWMNWKRTYRPHCTLYSLMN